MKTQDGHRIALQDALEMLPGKDGSRFVEVLRRGQLEVEIYAPRGHDPQTPHRRDEVYVILRGTGTFLCGTERAPFRPGDFLFVPAGIEHRFEDFTDDFATWVIFYGPDGGEQLDDQ